MISYIKIRMQAEGIKNKWYENGVWRRLHNGKFHSLYRSLNIVSVINSKRLRWAGHVARMEEGGVLSKF